MSSSVTLKEIAEELGVSKMTVSRAINNQSKVSEETRQRVLKKAKSMGYTLNYVAKSLASERTQTIGIVVPGIRNSFFPEVIGGIEEIVYERDYHLILTHSAEQWDREIDALETLQARRVDGILISVAESIENYDYYKSIMKSNIPLVFFNRCAEGINANCVKINDKRSAYQITKHLIETHGYKHIAHLMGPEKISNSRERKEGYLSALQEYGLEINEKWIVEAGFNEDGGYDSMKKLLHLSNEDFPRAVVAVNDPVAFGAMEAIHEFGLKIPDSIAVVGFTDDIRSSTNLIQCPLTTVRQPAFELGKRAAEKLINSVENELEPIETKELKTEIVFRKSCGCN